MPPIPKNNLRERMLKLGYNPDIVTIKPPVLDNSKVIVVPKAQPSSFVSAPAPAAVAPPPLITNIDDWSDFEDDFDD